MTVTANPADVGSNIGAAVVNGPQWFPSDAKIGVVPSPGVNSATAVVRGLVPGVSTLTIKGLQAIESGAEVTKVITVTVTVGTLTQFLPTVSEPEDIPA